jgi:hypothetical protein
MSQCALLPRKIPDRLRVSGDAAIEQADFAEEVDLTLVEHARLLGARGD